MGNKNSDIWKTVLEKTASGNQFPAATVIKDRDKSYQVFEVLVAETFARVAPEWEWTTTKGSGDGGIDFFAKLKRQINTPFVSCPTNQLLLGQVKRRKTSYRYDALRNDITQMFELYTSTYLAQNYSLFELLFVISTDHQNNIASLRKNLEATRNDRQKIIFTANLRSPIHIVDAKDLIQYWSLNFAFVRSLLGNVTGIDELVQLQDYLETVQHEGFNITVRGKTLGKIGEFFEKTITISTASNIPVSFFIKWRPAQEDNASIQLVYPLQAIISCGVPFQVCASGKFHITFRCLQEGDHDLGELDILTDEQILIQSIPLGHVFFSRGLMPIYQMRPQKEITNKLQRDLSSDSVKFQVMTIRGIGGIGKSSLISELIIRLANNNNICVDIQQRHSILNPQNLMLELFVQLLMSQVKKPLFSDSYLQELKWHLGSGYIEDWTADLTNFFENKDHYSSETVCKSLASLMFRLSAAHPIVIWLSDLHWIDQKSASMLVECINTLEQNQLFLTNRVAFLLEGRSNELLEEEYHTYHPVHWEGLLKKLRCVDYTLRPWNKEDCRDFIQLLLQIPDRGKDRDLYERLSAHLLEHSGGSPMFIIEQTKLLIGLGKLALNEDGTLHIQDAQWSNAVCTEILRLTKRRVTLFLEKHGLYGTLVILYARLSAYATDGFKQYIVRQIYQRITYADEIAIEYDMFALDEYGIVFSHEYFSQEFARRLDIDEALLYSLISYLEKDGEREESDTVCLLLLLDLCSSAENIRIARLAAPLFWREDRDWIAVNLLLCKLPDSALNSVGLSKRAVLYGTVSSLMRTSNYSSSEKYAKKLYKLPINSREGDDSLRYYLLVCQQLSNIAASKLEVGKSISYAQDGLFQLSFQEQLNGPLNEDLCKMKAILESRLAVCYLFSGDEERAIDLHRTLCKTPGTDNEYILTRLGYEYNGILLHQEPEQAVKELENLYAKAETIPEMYPTEFYLVDVMRMVGKLILCTSSADAAKIYRDSVVLAKKLEQNESKYISASNFLVMSASYILEGGDTEQALSMLFHACEHAIDLQREEILWKCYINIAQLYYYMGSRSEAANYAEKACEIICRALDNNKNAYRDSLLRLFSQPLSILKRLCDVPKSILGELSKMVKCRVSLQVQWQDCVLFLMK